MFLVLNVRIPTPAVMRTVMMPTFDFDSFVVISMSSAMVDVNSRAMMTVAAAATVMMMMMMVTTIVSVGWTAIEISNA
jgi:hypothetical protein